MPQPATSDPIDELKRMHPFFMLAYSAFAFVAWYVWIAPLYGADWGKFPVALFGTLMQTQLYMAALGRDTVRRYFPPEPPHRLEAAGAVLPLALAEAAPPVLGQWFACDRVVFQLDPQSAFFLFPLMFGAMVYLTHRLVVMVRPGRPGEPPAPETPPEAPA